MGNDIKMKKKIDPKSLGIPNICFSLVGKSDKREKEFLKQRLERGFDDSETWCLASTIAKFILPRIKRFQELHDEFVTDKADVDIIIQALELIIRDNGSWLFTEAEEKTVKKGLKKLSNNFLSLWW
jgi:hypothetical protein